MMKKCIQTALVLIVLAMSVNTIFADLKSKSEITTKMKGIPLLGMFGANKPSQQVLYLKGNKQRTDMLRDGKIQTSNIIDLDREVMINLDHKNKNYTEISFEQFRAMMQKNMADARSDMEQEKPDFDLKVSVDVKTPGDTKSFAGHETRKVILEIKIKGSGKVENSDGESADIKGSMDIVSTQWMTTAAGHKEMRNFSKKMADVMVAGPGQPGMLGMLGQAMGDKMDIGAAFKKLQAESEKLEGVAMYTHTIIKPAGEVVGKKEKPKKENSGIPRGLGGLMKKFGRKSKSDGESSSGLAIETTTKVLSWETNTLSAETFEIPADFKKIEMNSYKN